MSVEEIRKKIDGLDDRIHDLLMERADMVLRVGEEKRKNNAQIIQPDREDTVVRRILARHKGVLPPESVERIWREIMREMSQLQMD